MEKRESLPWKQRWPLRGQAPTPTPPGPQHSEHSLKLTLDDLTRRSHL